jgi:hypothetical protein
MFRQLRKQQRIFWLNKCLVSVKLPSVSEELLNFVFQRRFDFFVIVEFLNNLEEAFKFVAVVKLQAEIFIAF